jgi:hypothetical protein
MDDPRTEMWTGRRCHGEICRYLQPDPDAFAYARAEGDHIRKDNEIGLHSCIQARQLEISKECARSRFGDHDVGVGPRDAVTKVIPLRR